MNALTKLLIRRINATGPMTIADYMAECLLHPEHGYYSTRDPFGAPGDFTTAPEISQMFGELLGLCLAQSWLDNGQPNPFTLAELGPGRGTLMADILRVAAKVPGFVAAADIVMLEASPTLQLAQRKALDGYKATWIEAIDALPKAPLYLVANEFFDALPIRQFRRDDAGWREIQIVADDDALSTALSAPAHFAIVEHRLADTKPGDIVEICPNVGPIMQTISARIASRGGAAIIVDYGNWRSRGDTFQAVQKHISVNPLDDPGQVDLTAHVDFEALAASAPDVSVTALATQGDLLNRLGIQTRSQQLAQNLTGDALINQQTAHTRLTDPKKMGTLFKAIALYQNACTPPPGFDP